MLCSKCGGNTEVKPELWRTATIVGNWFIGFDDDGKPEVAGRINGGLGAGRYLISYSFVRDGIKVEPVLKKDQIGYMKWLLFDSAATWREQFTKASK